MALITKDIRSRWPGNCLVYSFDPALTEAEVKVIRHNLGQWENSGHIRFVERTTQNRYVQFVPDSQPLDGICSSSTMGMSGGQQFIHLDHDPGDQTIQHEIGHALGFYHEHKRRDRDDVVDINESKIKPEHRFQFEKVAVGEALTSGLYDLDSVMHYGSATAMSTDGHTALITAVDPSNSSRILAHDAGTALISPGDMDAAAFMERGTAHVYQLSGNGQLETVVQQEDWSQGYTIARVYTIGVNKFLFITKNTRMRIKRVNLDGSIGEEIQTRKWGHLSGWTHATEYSVLGTSYMMLYKAADGEVQVRKINLDGTIVEVVVSGTLESGWHFIAPFTIGVNNYLILSRLDGTVFIHELTFDGKVGQRKHEQTFGENFTVTQPYSVMGSTFVLMMNSSNGRIKVRKVQGDGRIGSTIQSLHWTKHWHTAIPYHSGGDTYLLVVNKGNGRNRAYRIESDGRIGSMTDDRRIGAGWGTVTVYGVGLGTYVLLIKPN